MPRGRPKKIKTEEKTDIVYDGKNAADKSGTTNFRDIFKLDESYTSLLLGIIVVIIAAVLFVSLFKNQNVFKPKVSQQIATQHIAPTVSPTQIAGTSPIETLTDTTEPTRALTPTQMPVKPMVTQAASPQTQSGQGKTYTVKAGDNLWQIAVSAYNDGYQWATIAKANNLANPNTLHAGDKLQLPQVTPTPSQIAQNKGTNPSVAPAQPKPQTYTVVHGDTLWDIAVRFYHDGYQWTKISAANHLTNPSVIHSGNVLTIP